MAEKNSNTAAKVVFILLAVGIAAFLSLWAASAIFMSWHGADAAKATPTAIFKYWALYGHLPKYKTSFAVSFALPFAVLFLLPLLLWAAARKRRSLHGDARFATQAEIQKMGFFDNTPTSLIVGKSKGQWLFYSGNQFVCLAAPTRSGKGVGLVVPNLLNYPASVVVMDIKGENHDLTSGFRAQHKQKVFRFAPFDYDEATGISRTHRYNPLSYISKDPAKENADIIKLSFMLYPDSVGNSSGNDDYFKAQSRSLFIGLVLYLRHTSGEVPCTFGEVMRLAGGRGKNLKDYILEDMLGVAEGYQRRNDLPRTCFDALLGYANQSDNTRSSIDGEFRKPFFLWENASVDNATSGDDFDLRKVRKEATSIYFVVPPNRVTEARVLINMFFSQLLSENLNELPSQNPELKYQCLLMMDEFTAAGAISIIQKGSAYIAGYNMRLVVVIQNTSQLVEEYGKAGADTLLSNLELLVMYTPANHPASDAEEYSKLLGYQTVKSKSKSRQHGGRGGHSESESDQRRALMLPQELREIPFEEEILVLRGHKPIYCDKIIYHADPAFQGRLYQPAPTPDWDVRAFVETQKSALWRKPVTIEKPAEIPLELTGAAVNSIEPDEAESTDKGRSLAEQNDERLFFTNHSLYNMVFEESDDVDDIMRKMDEQMAALGVDIEAAAKREEEERKAQIKAQMPDIPPEDAAPEPPEGNFSSVGNSADIPTGDNSIEPDDGQNPEEDDD